MSPKDLQAKLTQALKSAPDNQEDNIRHQILPKSLKWTVEIEVDQIWIEDGFDLTKERLEEIVDSIIPHAYTNEVRGKIVEAPDPLMLLLIQGYTI